MATILQIDEYYKEFNNIDYSEKRNILKQEEEIVDEFNKTYNVYTIIGLKSQINIQNSLIIKLNLKIDNLYRALKEQLILFCKIVMVLILLLLIIQFISGIFLINSLLGISGLISFTFYWIMIKYNLNNSKK